MTDEVMAGARAMYESCPQWGFFHETQSIQAVPWDDLPQKDRNTLCRAFAAGLAAMWRDIKDHPKKSGPYWLYHVRDQTLALGVWDGVTFLDENSEVLFPTHWQRPTPPAATQAGDAS